MKTLLISIIVAYGLMCLGMYLMQRRLLFFRVPALGVEQLTEQVFMSEGLELRGLVINENQQKALIYYGGNAEQIEQNIDFFKTVTSNFTVYLVPYRGYSNNPGEPSEAALYSDAENIFDEVAKKHVSVSLIGRSLGSGVATWLAVNRPIEKLILVTPYDSIENVAQETYWMFPVKLMIKDRFTSWKRAGEIKVETLVVIAGADEVISRARSENLVKYLPEESTQVLVLNTAAHNDVTVYPHYGESVRKFLSEKSAE